MDSDPRPLWTPRPRVGDTKGEPPGCNRMAPRVSGSSEPLTEGIHKDTDGPGQASECGLTVRSPSGPFPCPCELACVGLSAWTRPPPPSDSLPPRQDTGRSGRRCRRKVSAIMPRRLRRYQPTLQVFGSPVSSSSEASQCPLLPDTMVFFAGMRTLLDGSVTSLPCAST